jgi:hypothetical protein
MNTYSLAERKSKVLKADFAKAWQKRDCFKDFLDNVPDILPIIFSYEGASRLIMSYQLRTITWHAVPHHELSPTSYDF